MCLELIAQLPFFVLILSIVLVYAPFGHLCWEDFQHSVSFPFRILPVFTTQPRDFHLVRSSARVSVKFPNSPAFDTLAPTVLVPNVARLLSARLTYLVN